ncbi:MAG: glycosyltransferase 87 family protein, partial [Acidimicrobiales bacterium]
MEHTPRSAVTVTDGDAGADTRTHVGTEADAAPRWLQAAEPDHHRLDPRYLVPFAAVVGWVSWAYLRLRPPTSIVVGDHPLKNYGPWAYSHLAYSDLLTLYRIHRLADHAIPYLHVTIEYPVLTGFYMWSAAWIPGVQGYFVVSCLGLGACALGTFDLLYRWSPRYARIFAFSPLLLVYALLNWDLLAIVLMLGGWTLYRRRRFVGAGVLLSLGVCAKFFPIMLLVYCIVALLAVSGGRGRRPAVVMTAAAVTTGLVVNVPFAVARFHVWSDFFRFNADRRGNGGIFYALHLASTWPTSVVDALSAGVVLVVMVLAGMRVLGGGSPAYAAAAAFATFMLVNKVFSPQYMLWVLVFGLLAEWPVWTLAVVTVAGLVDFTNAMTTLHLLATDNSGFGWYFRWIFPLDRLVVLIAIFCGLVASAWQEKGLAFPWQKPVRTGAAGDPVAAGGAPPA